MNTTIAPAQGKLGVLTVGMGAIMELVEMAATEQIQHWEFVMQIRLDMGDCR